MRGFLQVLYQSLMRLHGLLILVAAGVFAVGLPAAMDRGMFVQVPVIATALATIVALFYLFQGKLLVGFREPERGGGVIFVLIAHFALAFLFLMVAMGAVIMLAPDSDETARPLATLAGGVSLGLSGATWLAALLLGTSEPPRNAGYRTEPRNVAYAGAQTSAQMATGSAVHGFLLATYRFVLQSHGLAMLIMAGVFFSKLPEAIERGLNIQMHTMIAVVTVIVAACYVIQRGLPDFFLRPSLGFGAVGALACHVIFGLIFFILLAGSKMIVFQIPYGVRGDGLGEALPTLTYLVTALSMALTLLLGLSRKPVSRRPRLV